MKAFAKLTLLTLVAGLMTFAAGCGGGDALPEGKSPEDIIKAGLLMQDEITQSIFEMKVDADLKGTVDGEKNSLKGNMKLSGTTDLNAKTMQIVFSVDGGMNDESGKADLELRVNDDGAFAKIGKVTVSDSDMQAMADLFLADYVGNWTKLSFLTADDVLSDGYAEIDYQEGESLPFKDIEYVGTKDILGVKSYQFHASVDESMMMDMIESTGESVADADEFFKAAEMSGDVYVAVEEGFFTGFEGVMKLTDEEMNGNVEISYLINPTKADTVKTPSYDKELTEDDIAALMFGGAPMGGMDVDDSAMTGDFDYNSDYDYADVDMDIDPAALDMMDGVDTTEM